MLRAIARERLGVDLDVLEAQLADATRGEAEMAYDRTTFKDKRRHEMRACADYVDMLRNRSTTNVTVLRGAA